MALDGALGSVLVAGDAAALCVAGVALCHICLRFAWQAWHLVTSTFVLRGRRVTIYLRFAWQAWHLVTSTFVLRGRRGTYGTGLALVYSGVTHYLCHTPSFTDHFVTHTIFHTPSLTTLFLCHTRLFHTIHKPSLTHHLSHTTLSPTIFDTPSFHIFPHTTLSHTIFHTHHLCHTPSFAHRLSHTIFVSHHL